jgi:mono/diheme cytochrome c family protein
MKVNFLSVCSLLVASGLAACLAGVESTSGSESALITDGGVDGAADAHAASDASADAHSPADAGPPPYTKAEVQQIFNQQCVGCHSGQSPSRGLPLDGDFTASTVKVTAGQDPSMNRIEPGQRNRSYLYLKLTGQALKGDIMPPSGSLTPQQIERIGRYIDAL